MSACTHTKFLPFATGTITCPENSQTSFTTLLKLETKGANICTLSSYGHRLWIILVPFDFNPKRY